MSSNKLYRVSAPGSLMVMGEHAVLYHHGAIVTAVNQRIFLTLKPRSDQKIIIRSSLGHLESDIASLKPIKPFEHILYSILMVQKKIQNGFELEVESQFSHKIGLGSSAAITVATVALLHYWLLNNMPAPATVYFKALEVIKKIQNKGSGGDLLASIIGGTLFYQSNPFNFKSLPLLPSLTVIYSGSKTPTATVIEKVYHHYQKEPFIYSEIFKKISHLTRLACELGNLFKQQQELMRKLQVSNETLDMLIHALEKNEEIWGAKISGSGLGDCVIGLSKNPLDFPISEKWKYLGIQQITACPSSQGLYYE